MDINLLSTSDIEYIRKHNDKFVYLDEDAICVICGTIFNSHYIHECITCDHDNLNNSDNNKNNYIKGKLSKNIRLLLNFNIMDLRALCEVHYCGTGSRARMVLNIMKSMYPNLDKRVTEILIRKIILRNKKKFYFLRDIDIIMNSIRINRRIGIKKVSRKKLIFINGNNVLNPTKEKDN